MMLKPVHLLLMILILTIFGCSSGGDKAVMPDIPGSPGYETPGEPRIENTNEGSPRMLWGIWTIKFDPLKRSIEVIPVRVSEFHIDITEMILPPACDDCFEIAVNGFDTVTRILDADVTLNNPYAISGRDVRGILFTNELGHLLTNPDDWTGLWDPPGGSSLNPFIAFAKSEPSRIFAGGAEHSENFLVHIPLPPAFSSITFAVDASYPGNCKEPYSIANFEQEVQLFDITTSSTPISVDVLDWQGDVSKVTLCAPEINGASFSPMVFEGGATWSYELINSAGAAEGEYEVRIIADSTNSPDTPLYDYGTIVIEHTVVPTVTDIDPVIGTSGFEYTDLVVNGTNFINSGIQVNLKMNGEPDIVGINPFSDMSTVTFDLDIPVNAAPGLYDVEVKNWTSAFGIGEDMFEITVLTPEIYEVFPQSAEKGEYIPDAAVWGWNIQGPGIEVTLKMDGEPDIEAVSINSWTEEYVKCDLSIPLDAAIGGYDVVLKSGNNIEVILKEGFFVVSDDPSMDFVNITPDWLNFFPFHVVTDGNYAYTTGRVNGLHIWDISTPGDPTWVNKVDPYADFVGSKFECEHFDVADGYAYVNLKVENEYEGSEHYLMVADIDPPESAFVLTYFPFDSWISDIVVDGTKAYIKSSGDEILILDISTPASPSILKHVSDTENTGRLTYDNGYVYVAAHNTGMLIVDVDPVESASVIKTVDTPGSAYGAVIDGGYAYIADAGAICIIDVDPPESASVLKSVDVPPGGNANRIAVSSGYAYVVGTTAPLQIFDVDPIPSAALVNTVSLNAYSRDVSASGDTAYVVCNATGLYAVDITDPPTASISSVQYTPGAASGLEFANDVLYIANGAAGVYAYDVSIPASLNLLTALDTDNAQDIAVDGAYAYLAEGWDSSYPSHLRILDIEPVESMSVYNSATMAGSPGEIEFESGYAFTDYDYYKLGIYDVIPQDTIQFVKDLDFPSQLLDLLVEDGYAYIACNNNTLVIADVDPAADASVIATLATDYAVRRVALAGDYAYVFDSNNSIMQIIDVAAPDSPSVVKVMGVPGRPGSITVQDGYAYIGTGSDGPGLAVVDIDPYDTAYVLTTFDMMPYSCQNVIRAGNYIYITGIEEGLHILEVI